MKRSSLLTIACVLLASCSTTAPETPPADTPKENPQAAAETIKIGFIGPLSGEVADLGKDILNGAKMKVDEINTAGGIGGRMIELIAEDGRCTGADAAAAARKLIDIDKVVAIHGGECSAETMAAAPIAEAAQVVMLSPASSNPDITTIGDFIFRDYPSDALKTEAMARYFTTKDLSRVAIVTENADFTQGFRSALVAKLPQAAVFDELVEPGTKDFRSLLTRLKRIPFDVIVLNVNSPANIALLLQQCRELGLEQLAISHDLGDSLEIPKLIGTASEGMQVINVPTLDPNGTFGKAFIAQYGEPQANLGWAGYGSDVLGILATAIGQAGTSGPAIRDALYAMPSYAGVIATVSFDKNGDVRGIPYVLREIRDGAFVTVENISVDAPTDDTAAVPPAVNSAEPASTSPSVAVSAPAQEVSAQPEASASPSAPASENPGNGVSSAPAATEEGAE